MARIKPQTLLLQSKKKKGPTRISVTTIITCNLIVVLILLCLVATYRHWSQRSRNQQEEHDLPNLLIINTSKGLITVELYKDGSPEIVDKFIDLCQKGHFKGMPFHRVIKHYVIQGGDHQRVGSAEDWTSKGKPGNQFTISPKHEAFMLGTSKTKPDSKGFELFITTAPIPDLNDKLIVFGRVIKGEDVVQEIEEVDTDEHYQPKSPIGIINVTLKREI
ncbi:peptidyl-prolyl cis-trans isomerase CYP21-4-like isoform X2 [Telopea speciosissima]|uniref:peptidyl-prolyl cis-trans isomerase CYP21-4-like isoform X2 n=1 Tax=Telopea speciosissima TaxID=54955 RepID=UPI001CC37256|nr:peptidyl-prolyl cis-trans isomerase CYP21-4-like isoform X2 [Telopea speciosissima]